MEHSKRKSWYLGHRLFRSLSRPQRRAFRNSFKREIRKHGHIGQESLKSVLNERYMSGGDLVLFYVDWKETPEGVRYWMQIKDNQNEKFKPVTNDERDF